jgi:hypothetical protein
MVFGLDVNEFSMKKFFNFNNFSIVSWNILWNPKNFQITFIKSYYSLQALQQYKEHAQILLVWM